MRELLKKTDADYILNQMEFCSNMGKKYFQKIKKGLNLKEVEEQLELTSMFFCIFENENEIIKYFKSAISHINDIENTLLNLNSKKILDEIEMFEIKNFLYFSMRVQKKLNKEFYQIYFENPHDIFSILDPQNKEIHSFFVYDEYSEKLKTIRNQKKEYQKKDLTENPEYIDIIRKEKEEEYKIKKNLTEKLKLHSKELINIFNKIAILDFLIAKSEIIEKYNLVKPILKNKIKLEKIFNPKVLDIHVSNKKRYQRIDFELEDKPTIITGSNMSGKTLSTKTIALISVLLKLGFYVPAEKAELKYFETIYYLSGDLGANDKGLSSYAGEIKYINKSFVEAQKNKEILIVLDEPARTTNPKEGTAIIEALISELHSKKCSLLITTHYPNIIAKNAKKMRVKGLMKDRIGEINENNINDFIDYSFVEDEKANIPEEAITIAEILGVDEVLIKTARKFLG
ncbi:MAG: MutS-related protein [Thermotogota bacterium]